MNERITLIAELNNDDLNKIELYMRNLNTPLCKVPFGKM